MSPSGRHAPLILRVAGLPAETMAPFSHPLLMDAITERERLRGELIPLRASLVDCLHRAVRGAAKAERRFLLSVKRGCFNGESLATRRTDPRWDLLAKLASTLVDEVIAREEGIATLDSTIERMYHLEARRERENIAQLSENPAFLRGVALASPLVVHNFDRLKGREADVYGRREKRLCLTFLRYASRAALKLSPFATLTRTAIGHALEENGGFAFVPGGSWHERSTVCLHRELLSQYTCLLLRCRRFAESLPVALNETLSAESDGCYRFFRPSRWVFDGAGRAFREDEAAFVRVKLEGPLVRWLLAELREGTKTLRHLLAGMQTEFGAVDCDSLEEGLTGLLGAGFLSFVVPWDTSAPDLEQEILARLDGLPGGSELDLFRKGFRELAESLRGYAATRSPARFLNDRKREVESLFHALAAPAGLPSPIEFKAPDNTFEEDVFLLPGDGIAQLSQDRLGGLIEDLDPLARLANLHDSRHDLLHTLAAFGDRRWPGVTEIGFLDFFASAQPLFDAYVRHRRSPAPHRPPAFNPLQLAPVADLVRWRQRVEDGIAACFGETAEVRRLCPRALTALLDQVPAVYAGSHEFCAFVQPLDPEGRTWVVNSIAEGYGRYGGRFTAGMDRGTRERWTSWFTPLSILDRDGERVELIDMSCPGGRTIDVHVPQTHRVLKMPGEHSSLPAQRVLRLCDLRVHLRGADRPPVLTDRAGQRLLPVQLGSSAARRRPTLLKFLASFGPGDLHRRLPVRPRPPEDGVETIDRHLVGSAVYSRKRWLVEPQPWLRQIDGRDEAGAFADINAWRLAKSIPDRVFALERIVAARHKPQYIDFSSPSFVQILKSMLKREAKTLVLEEVLPAPEQFPVRRGGWGVEVQLESFCFRHRGLCSPRAVRGDRETARVAGAIRKEP